MVGLDEHGLLFVTEAEPPDRGVGVGVVDRDEPGDGLLLEPFTGVSGCDRGAGRQVVDGHLAGVTDGVVEPETAPEVDAEQLERPDGCFEQPGVERGVVGCRGGSPTATAVEVRQVSGSGFVGHATDWHTTIEAPARRSLGGCLRIG